MKTGIRIALIAVVTAVVISGGLYKLKPDDTRGMHASAPSSKEVCLSDPHIHGAPIFSGADFPCPPGSLGYIDIQGEYHLTSDVETRELALTKLLKMQRHFEFMRNK